MREVAVLGWYGHKNFGDELMLKGLQNLFHGWKVTVMNGANGTLDFDSINKCDLFVLGGGELIHDNRLFMPSPSRFKFPSLAYRAYTHTGFAKRSWVHKVKIPKIILGCGVNVEEAQQIASHVVKDLQQFDYIGLRDKTAVHILTQIPSLRETIELFYDLTFALDIETLETVKHRTELAIVIPTDRFTTSDKGVLVTNISVNSRDWLKEKLQDYKETIFLAFGELDNDDYETCKGLSSVASNTLILRTNNLSMKQIFALLSECDIVFPYRLHGLILSFILGKRYDFYTYHRKLQRVHDTIKDSSPKTIRRSQYTSFNKIFFFRA